ncbi:MAG: type II secretion system F family protein [Desulfobulbaceae bacterium]|nr:type II secretion system F family protein [Desulfobulbaceae bacterium]
MATFAYSGRNPQGEKISGFVNAISINEAQTVLLGRDVLPTKLKESSGKSSKGSAFSLRAKVRTPELILFTKQLRTMLNAGLTFTRILAILKEQSTNNTLIDALGAMDRDIAEGGNLTDAFLEQSHIFPPLYCSLIRAGEMSGTLPQVLERLIYIIEHEYRLQEDIKAALRYPKMVVFALAIAFFILLTFVIPKFVGVFQSAGLVLPLPTRICLAMYNGLQFYWPYLLVGGIALFLALRWYGRTVSGSYFRHLIQLRMPILGPLFNKAAMSRFASILSILTASGVTILSSIAIISDAIGNSAIAREFDKLSTQMEEGHGIAKPLREAKFFPPMVVNMVAIGEEAGSLEEMLRQIASHYDEEVEYTTKGLGEAIGPVLIVSLTAVVGFFALAIFLPMWDLTKIVQ